MDLSEYVAQLLKTYRVAKAHLDIIKEGLDSEQEGMVQSQYVEMQAIYEIEAEEALYLLRTVNLAGVSLDLLRQVRELGPLSDDLISEGLPDEGPDEDGIMLVLDEMEEDRNGF